MTYHMIARLSVIFRDVVMQAFSRMIGPFPFLMITLSPFLLRVFRSIHGLPLQIHLKYIIRSQILLKTHTSFPTQASLIRKTLEFSTFMMLTKMLAQRPIALVLMMINSCSYSTNDLVFNQSQIIDQGLSRCLASTKDSKSSFEASTC